MALDVINRFPRTGLTELAIDDPEAWAKESFEIAAKIAYQNGALRGTPKDQRKDCRAVTNAAVLPVGYTSIASKIADRRMTLSAYRLVDLLRQIQLN